MKVTFVGIGAEQLSISLLSSVLRREGHETALAFHPALFDYDGFLDVGPLARLLDRTEHLIDEIVASDPDLLAFSVLTASYRWSLRVAAAVRERTGASVIFGGVHPSAVPEVCLRNECVDYVCVGEGEEALVALCESLPPQGARPTAPIPNLWWQDRGELVVGPAAPFLADLDSLPYFDKELWRGEVRVQDNWMTMSSRGCPYRCTFCFNNFFAKLPGKGGGKYLRQRSIDHMMGELIGAKAEWGMRRVDFQDDIFTVDKQWIHDFLAEYRREIDLPFQCLVHPRYIDHDMARWLKDAGCQHVQMGVQSVDEEYKRRQLLRMERDSHLRNALDALRTADLDLKLDHMLGLPGEPLSAQEQARALYAEFPPRRIQTFWLVHLPGVSLTTDAVRNGVLTQDDYDRIAEGEVRHYHHPDVDGGPSAETDASIYRRYELLFRLLPLVPRSVARRLRIRHVPTLGPRLAHGIGVGLEVVNAVKHRDEETRTYLLLYAHQIRKQLPGALADRWRERRRRGSGGRPTTGTSTAATSHRSHVHHEPVSVAAAAPAGVTPPTVIDLPTPPGSAGVPVTLGARRAAGAE